MRSLRFRLAGCGRGARRRVGCGIVGLVVDFAFVGGRFCGGKGWGRTFLWGVGGVVGGVVVGRLVGEGKRKGVFVLRGLVL